MAVATRLRRIPAPVWWTLAAWLPMLLWYAALRPGIMSADSLASWEQAVGAPWSDLQPPVYTAAMWVSHTIGGGPSLLTLCQSLFLASGFVAIGRALIRAGARPGVVVAVLGVLVCTPMVDAFAITLWKDIPFAGVMLFVTARLLDLAGARERGDREAARLALRSMVAWGLVAVVLRQNGVLVAGGILGLLFLFVGGQRRQALLGIAACAVVLLGMKNVVYPILDVHPGPPNSQISTMLHDIASMAYRDPSSLDRADVKLLDSVAPVSAWAEGFQRFGCQSANWQYDPVFANWQAIDGKQGKFISLWLELLRERPKSILSNRECVGAVAWRPDNEGVLYTVSQGIDENRLGLRTDPLIGGLTGTARDVIDDVNRVDLQPFLWRAPGWIYAAYLVAIVLAVLRSRWLLVPFAPLLATQVAVAGLNPAQDARYMLPAMFCAIALLTLVSGVRRGPRTGIGPVPETVDAES